MELRTCRQVTSEARTTTAEGRSVSQMEIREMEIRFVRQQTCMMVLGYVSMRSDGRSPSVDINRIRMFVCLYVCPREDLAGEN